VETWLKWPISCIKYQKGDLSMICFTYKSVICGHYNLGNLEYAFKVQDEMEGKWFEPNIDICNAFIEEFCKKGEIVNA
jgi:pentatricopeptide repeat protein